MAIAWTVAEAKAKFSELLDRAAEAGPQIVTRNGRADLILGTDAGRTGLLKVEIGRAHV